MRDLALILIFCASIPFILKRPSLGVVMWIWLSVMNPHRLAYTFAYDLPFAATAAGLTFVSLLFTKDRRHLPMTAPVLFLACFTLWMCVTSLVPFHPGSGYFMWSRVMKIMLMTFVALAVIKDKQQIHWVVWIVAFSLGFYGVKGGIFTIVTGGSYLVWGPAGSFIEGNNEVALALVLVIPLMRYVQLGFKQPWLRWAMTAAMVLTALAAVGSKSRGALLAIAAMSLFLWWKSRNKFAMALVLGIAAIGIVMFMPEDWMTRMNTIGDYQEDASAMGRINAWWMAFNLARANFFGGGFEIYDFDTFARYAPNPLDVHAAHSIYFQVLGEHGFVGLFLFVSIGAATWLAASDAKRKAKGIPDLLWASQLMDMVKVSMIGYAIGGAFLSLAYFDVPYYVTVIAVATRELVVARWRTAKAERTATSPRRERFGVVPLADGVAQPDAIVTPVPSGGGPRGADWRGQGAFTRRDAFDTPPRRPPLESLEPAFDRGPKP